MNQSTGQGQTTIYTEGKNVSKSSFCLPPFPFILYTGPVSKPMIVSSCKFMVLPLIKIQGFVLCCVVFHARRLKSPMLGMLLLATIGRSGGLYQLLVWQFGRGKEHGAGGLRQGGRVIETWGWGLFLLLPQVCRWKPRWQRPGDTCWEEKTRAHIKTRLSREPTLPPARDTEMLLLSGQLERRGVQLQVRCQVQMLLHKPTDAAF